MSVKSKIQSLITAANAKTGETDTTLTDAVQSLIDGYGISKPSSISKIDGGSFTVASDTTAKNYLISHNLGEKPKGFVVWSDDLAYGGTESHIMLVNAMYKTMAYSSMINSSFLITRKHTDGLIENSASGDGGGWLTSTTLKISVDYYYKAGITYKWIAWA